LAAIGLLTIRRFRYVSLTPMGRSCRGAHRPQLGAAFLIHGAGAEAIETVGKGVLEVVEVKML
jgi:hypothetical protein